jgi:staphylococcal nuclease domain-containing protein 1
MGNSTEKRQFGTIGTGKRNDVGEVLVAEGLATTQYHREGEEKSPNYDALVIAEGNAKSAKKGVHSDSSELKKGAVNDLTDPKKAKAYSGSLMRAGFLKAVVEYVFNGNRFKLLVPAENCSIVFAIENLRSPQPTVVSSRGPSKKAEPFGDTARFHSRLNVLQRSVEIKCKGVTNGGVITGELFVGGGAQRRDFGLELVGAGLATVDERKIEYGEAPKVLIEAQNRAIANKAGLWSLEQKQEQVCKYIFPRWL